MNNLVFYGGLFASAVPLTAAFALLLDQDYPVARKWLLIPILCLEGVVGIGVCFAVIDNGHEERMKREDDIEIACGDCPQFLGYEE